MANRNECGQLATQGSVVAIGDEVNEVSERGGVPARQIDQVLFVLDGGQNRVGIESFRAAHVGERFTPTATVVESVALENTRRRRVRRGQFSQCRSRRHVPSRAPATMAVYDACHMG